MARKKNWSKTIEVEHEATGMKLDVRLYERTLGASVYYSFRMGGQKVQKSTKRSDRGEAEVYAREVVKQVMAKRLAGRTGNPLTLGEAFIIWARDKAPHLSDEWAKYGHTRRDLFEEAWGQDLRLENLSQHHVDAYSRKRMAGELSPFEDGEKGRDPMEVRAGTVDGDFRWLSSVFNFLRRQKVNGRKLIVHNPLHDVEWPREKNVRRPIASHERFTRTMAKADEVDPKGRLRCMLALARYTGRREAAICHMRASDLLRTEEDVKGALASMGLDERAAEHMPHGAIRWREDVDKMGFATIAPLSERARAALDDYLRQNPRLGDAYLFPAPTDDSEPIRPDLAGKWLVKAEKLAELPKLRGGRWHPYRRLWATERKHLPDEDVAAAGGWKDTRALNLAYQQADPATMQQVVEAGQ